MESVNGRRSQQPELQWVDLSGKTWLLFRYSLTIKINKENFYGLKTCVDFSPTRRQAMILTRQDVLEEHGLRTVVSELAAGNYKAWERDRYHFAQSEADQGPSWAVWSWVAARLGDFCSLDQREEAYKMVRTKMTSLKSEHSWFISSWC